MKIEKIRNLRPFRSMFEKDINGRKVDVFLIEGSVPCSSAFYPDFLFYTDSENIVNPIDEKIMSLDFERNRSHVNFNFDSVSENPMFYFIYNTDNYYHFVYDTLPYLISYKSLKKEIPNLKLLMSYPNFSKSEFYRFVEEFLEICGISKDEIEIVSMGTKYSKVYISESFTHGIDSNLPPRSEIYDFFHEISEYVKSTSKKRDFPKKVYISRRSWVHGDTSNIGTNYTDRRKMESEDKLVDILEKRGYKEIFTETMSTFDKIALFIQLEEAIGAIGGGLCNVLFSGSNCRLVSICSPVFLEINSRFKFCFDRVDTEYFEGTFHLETGEWKKWMRVKSFDIIGEVEEVLDNHLLVMYTDSDLAGWNSDIEYKKKLIRKEECTAIDKGLNSKWDMNFSEFEDIISRLER